MKEIFLFVVMGIFSVFFLSAILFMDRNGLLMAKTNNEKNLMVDYLSFGLDIDVKEVYKDIYINQNSIKMKMQNKEYVTECPNRNFGKSSLLKTIPKDLFEITYEDGYWYIKTSLTKYVPKEELLIHIEECVGKMENHVVKTNKERIDVYDSWN